MALITRISRLFTADLHAVLDRIEEPQAQLKQAIREMEESCTRDQQRLRWLTQEREQLHTQHTELEAGLRQLDEELDVCFRLAKEELARGLTRRKLHARRQQKAVASSMAEAGKNLEQLRLQVEENSSRLELMRCKAEVLVDDTRETDGSRSRDYPWPDCDAAIGDDEVEVAFLQEKQRRAGP